MKTARPTRALRLQRPAAPKPQRLRGFTLIEMVVVLAIVGLLAAAAQPLHALVQRRQQEQALREALRSIRGALDEHRRAVEAKQIAPGPQGSPWPATLGLLAQGIPVLDEQGQPRRDGQRLYLLRRLPRDPLADAALPPEASWDVRASTSPPGSYGGGDDVFDVASRADGRALDGSLYRTW